MSIDSFIRKSARATLNQHDYDWNFEAAEQAFRRALQLDDNNAVTYQWYGECLAAMGRHTDAITHLARAQELDPLSTNISAVLGRQGFFYARDYARAEAQLRNTIQTERNFWVAHSFLGWVHIFQGRFDDAIAAFQSARRLDDNSELIVGLAYACGAAGRTREAADHRDALLKFAGQRYLPPMNIALVYIGCGELDNAFEWLDKACDDRSQWLSDILVDPAFDPLRPDPRYLKLLSRMKLRPLLDRP